jgi:hypothetical protein
MCFERLVMRSANRAIKAGNLDEKKWELAHEKLLSTMATIGELEGAEEGGLDEVLAPDIMVDKVHMVRGGLLFSLAAVGPKLIEDESMMEKLELVEEALVKLGTAFQLVDDITDFEFDLTRKSHNIVVAEIFHAGTKEEKEKLSLIRAGEESSEGTLETLFVDSARRALERAKVIAGESLASLESLGFWFPAKLSSTLVQGIVADHGEARMEKVVGK